MIRGWGQSASIQKDPGSLGFARDDTKIKRSGNVQKDSGPSAEPALSEAERALNDTREMTQGKGREWEGVEEIS